MTADNWRLYPLYAEPGLKRRGWRLPLVWRPHLIHQYGIHPITRFELVP